LHVYPVIRRLPPIHSRAPGKGRAAWKFRARLGLCAFVPKPTLL